MNPDYVVMVMLAFVAAFIGFDVWLAKNKREGDTYSEILSKAGNKWRPLIMLMSFGFGLLAGHWWW